MFLKTWDIVFKFQHIAVSFLVALVTTSLYLTQGSYWKIVTVQNMAKEKHSSLGCDLSSGKWVYDNTSYPMYKERQCRFVENHYACERQGRKDHKYQNWRWQPHHCDLPKFNATVFLEKIRGKKVVYVGDSLMRNQWESMLCLLESAPRPSHSSLKDFSFSIPEYNVRINFYWSPLLVESNLDHPLAHKRLNITLRTESIENHGRHWNDADILIFDSFAWWVPNQDLTLLWGAFGSAQAIYKKERLSLRYFEMAMETWSDWLEFNINRAKTTMYFMSMSPIHSDGEQWGAAKGQNCYGESKQILPRADEQWGTLVNHRLMAIVESTIQELHTRGIKVQYINITQLSAYRKDAHPSIYGSFAMSYRLRNRSTTKPANPTMFSDCLHWCLPGVPDIWNQFLYAYIIKSS